MQTVQAQAIPNQQLQCQLGTQAVTLVITQTTFGLFMTVMVAGVTIISNVLCENLNRVVRDAYLGFVGDFVWYSTQDESDPVFTGIGSQYLLIYLSEDDLATVV